MPIPFNLPFVDNQALRNWAARLISDINAALSSGGGGGKGPSTSRITLVAGLQEADTDSTYKVFASSETVDPNALGTGTPSHTFRAVVNVPANSTGEIVLHDATNHVDVYDSGVLTGPLAGFEIGSAIVLAYGGQRLEVWMSTPNNTGGNANCLQAVILTSFS